MKRFVWRLQRVLDIKIKAEQAKRLELLKLTERLAHARRELLTQLRILENVISDVARKNPQERLGEQEFFLKCSPANDEVIKKLKNRAGEIELQQRKKTAEVLKVRRFRKSLERLRAEAKTQFIYEQEKLEQKELDEGTTIGFVRKIIRTRQNQ